ncbi:MAG: hydrogenase formation protein HypD, partial [Leptonema illini]
MSEAALFHPLRNVANVQSLLRQIADEVDPGRSYRYMEFCGGHTHALFH